MTPEALKMGQSGKIPKGVIVKVMPIPWLALPLCLRLSLVLTFICFKRSIYP